MIKVVIVEDDKEILQSLINLLAVDEDIAVTGTFLNAEAFITGFSRMDMDVVLMDIGLPGKSGIQAVAELKPKKSSVQYIMCTVYDDEEKIFNALCVGATGYLLKNTTSSEISEAIKTVYGGGSMMSASIARKVVQSFQNRNIQSKALENLTPRQWEILNFLDQLNRICTTFQCSLEHDNCTFETSQVQIDDSRVSFSETVKDQPITFDYVLERNDDRTNLSLQIHPALKIPKKWFFDLLMKRKMNHDSRKTLENLKVYCEGMVKM